jgi:beta-aspartyl-peptidase (threonine type)
MRNTPLGIICHGGAGVVRDKKAAGEGLAAALELGYKLLRQSVDALDAAIEAVRVMEDDPTFNCGTGSRLTLDGKVEMDAAVMTQDQRFGGVCCISGVKNPVLVARKVMTDTDHLLMCGDGATRFARKLGFEEYDPVTDDARARLAEVKEKGTSTSFPNLDKMMKLGTAGAVAMDKHGRLAVATSSGGIVGRLAGRIGDSAIPGAGTYAGPSGAVSCTGHGESIVKLMLARDIAERMKTLPANVAVTLAMSEPKRRKMMVGAVGFDARGSVCFGHTTPDMSYGYMVADKLFLFAEDTKSKRGQ